MNKKSLTEADIRTKFITPAIVGAHGEKWNVMTQIREEAYFTKGRVIVRGKTVKRGEAKKADYLLSCKLNLPLAVVEAKDNHHAVGAGMQQALEYAETLDVPFAYSSNGDAFLEHDRAAARTEWKDAASLLASIHGKLQLKISGDVQHTVNGEVAFTLPPSALPLLAQMRRDVLTQAHAEEAVEIGGLRC